MPPVPLPVERTQGAFFAEVSTSQSRYRSTAPLPRGASGEEVKLYEMPRPLLDRSNNDDRRQRRKQGVAVGAAASRMQGPNQGRSRCWEPQPGQWHAVRRDGEVYFLLFLYCSGPTPIVSRKTRRKWAAEAKPVCSATLPMLSSVVSRSFCAASMRRALM